MGAHLNFALVDRLHEPGGGGEEAGVQAPPGGWNDLAAAAVDGVGVERHVVDVEADAAEVLLGQHSLNQQFQCSSFCRSF